MKFFSFPDTRILSGIEVLLVFQQMMFEILPLRTCLKPGIACVPCHLVN
jgi:hypothetical protein